MEIVIILRELWRRRVIVVLIALLALLAGFAVAFRLPSLESRKHEVGIATAGVLVDTPNSQVIGVAPKGSDTLGVRAGLIANLMTEGVVKASIAERAGIPPDDLDGVSDSSVGAATEKPAASSKAYVLRTRVAITPGGDRLPIIEIEAEAPDAARAAKLADAAVVGLGNYLDSKATSEQVSEAERLRVSGLGPPQASDVVRGPKTVFAFAVVIFVFAAGCAVMLGALALIRGWRVASAMEDQVEPDQPAAGDELARFEEQFGAAEADERAWREHAMTPPADDEHTRD